MPHFIKLTRAPDGPLSTPRTPQPVYVNLAQIAYLHPYIAVPPFPAGCLVVFVGDIPSINVLESVSEITAARKVLP